MHGPDDEIGARMKALGLNPDDVRTVILTHLDVDHVGGVGWFPRADVLVHRPEYAAALGFMGRVRPFPASRALDDLSGLHIVPLAGHSYGQVGVILETGEALLLFSADHILSQDWFLEDWATGQPYGVFGALFYPERAAETTQRIQRLVHDLPTVLLPDHDPDAPRRLVAREKQSVSPRTTPYERDGDEACRPDAPSAREPWPRGLSWIRVVLAARHP